METSGSTLPTPQPRFGAVARFARRGPALFAAAALACVDIAVALETEHVPVAPDSTPFFAALTDLGSRGYLEDEYFVSGTANVYGYDASQALGVTTADVPYTTRILIRRPANPADFNGIVVFEMMNPTATWDIDFIWQYAQDLLMREGYIWVGQTIRENAVASLKGFDPVRYAPISLVERGLSYDAFGDIAILLRDPLDPENPLAGYDVTHVLGAGYSQSGDWLTTFSNELHESKRAWNGVTAFDGYLNSGGNGAARALWSGDLGTGFGLYADDRRYNRVDAPFFRIHSETEVEVFTFPVSTVRQPDSAIYRQWEVAGTSHADDPSTTGISATIERDLGFPLPACNNPVGDVAMAPYISAALQHLANRVVDGTEPPPSLYLELDGDGNVARDADGNALGGVRIPEVEVPIGTYLPFNSGGGPCILASTFLAFTPEEIAIEYPNHGSYVARFNRAVNDLRRGRYLLPEDAEAYKVRAAESDTGK